MKIFTALFDMAVLPIVAGKDVLMILPDLSCGKTPFEDTRDPCKQIDYDLGAK